MIDLNKFKKKVVGCKKLNSRKTQLYCTIKGELSNLYSS